MVGPHYEKSFLPSSNGHQATQEMKPDLTSRNHVDFCNFKFERALGDLLKSLQRH
jgi:hypothetical protein